MAGARVRLRIDQAKLTATVGPIAREAAERAAVRTRDKARSNVISAGLVNTGKLAETMTYKMIMPASSLFQRAAIGSPVPYAKYPEFGTRAHGPVRASRLVFKPKGSNKLVFAKRVRGVYPRQFMLRALDSLRPKDFE